jgi:hypothetical protein
MSNIVLAALNAPGLFRADKIKKYAAAQFSGQIPVLRGEGAAVDTADA